MKVLKDIIEIQIYATNDLTWKDFLGDKYEEIKAEFPRFQYSTAEMIVKISDYNKIAKLYGIEQYQLRDDEYIMLCNFDSQKQIINRVLEDGKNTISIKGKEYQTKYNECKDGFIQMSTSHTNTGIILVPDNCSLNDDMKETQLLIANYNANTDDERHKIEEMFASSDSGFVQNLSNKGLDIDGFTKISLIEASVGLATIITFIAIYLGIIF